MSIGASMLVKRTSRGDDMFVTSVARYAQQALDLDAESTLPGGPTGDRPAGGADTGGPRIPSTPRTSGATPPGPSCCGTSPTTSTS